ncbi:hypothetical protein AB0E96_36025 [Kitasatospora sp. NPDC036755]|uniref:hypothetical protein n=1 Tax=Kitasatospora sp. NPDC036755 TaxID=3154600 RepID=UPI0034060B81
MGRDKAGKPRRSGEAAGYALRRLRPPGYDRWITVAPGAYGRAVRDTRLSPQAVATARRLHRLAPLYGSTVPEQALWLDLAVDRGVLRVRRPDGGIGRLSVADLATLPGDRPGDADLRGAVHELHAAGAVLVEPGDEEELVLRVVVRKPAGPGGSWLFDGDPAGAPDSAPAGDPADA